MLAIGLMWWYACPSTTGWARTRAPAKAKTMAWVGSYVLNMAYEGVRACSRARV